MNTWIIGASPKSIGEEVANQIDGPVTITDSDVDVRQIQDLYTFIKDQGPFVNVVFASGVNKLMWIAELEPREVRRIFETNVMGFMNVLHALTYYQDGGNVVAIGSDAARVPMRGSIAYCASKAALVHAVRVAAREMAPAWRINCVSPGIVEGTMMTEYIDTEVPRFRGWSHEQHLEYERSMIPTGRRTGKEEVARLVIDVLFGPPNMTGANIEITGGK
jgi:NAD(P)-dependent dehydrogenase (short-subunit alcohol dehydrogenase family)